MVFNDGEEGPFPLPVIDNNVSVCKVGFIIKFDICFGYTMFGYIMFGYIMFGYIMFGYIMFRYIMFH